MSAPSPAPIAEPAAVETREIGLAAGLVREAFKALLVCEKDLRIEWRSLDNLPSMFFFALLVLVIFNFGFDFTTADFSQIGPGVLWVAFSFCGVLAFGHSFALEKETDGLQGLALAPIDPGTIYLGKTLANLVSMAIVEAVVLLLTAVLFNADILSAAGPLIVVAFTHTLGYAALGTLFAAMTARTRRGDVLLPVLLFGFSAPLMMSAVRATAAVLEGQGAYGERAAAWVTMSLIFDLVFLTAGYLTFEHVIEE